MYPASFLPAAPVSHDVEVRMKGFSDSNRVVYKIHKLLSMLSILAVIVAMVSVASIATADGYRR